jgi:hypothetical protein
MFLVGIAHLTLLFAAYGPGGDGVPGALDAINRGPGKYIVVPFIMPPAVFLLALSAGQFYAEFGSSIRVAREVSGALALVAISLVATFSVFRTDGVAIDRLVASQYAPASAAVDRLIGSVATAPATGQLQSTLRKLSKNIHKVVRQKRADTIGCPTHAADWLKQEAGDEVLDGKVAADLATYYCAVLVAPEKRAWPIAVDLVECFLGAFISLGSVVLVYRLWDLRESGTQSSRVRAASFFLVLVVVLLLLWVPLASASAHWIQSFDDGVKRVQPYMLLPFYFLEIVMLVVLHAKRGLAAITAAVSGIVATTVNVLAFFKPDGVRSVFDIHDLGNFALFAAGTTTAMVLLVSVSIRSVDELIGTVASNDQASDDSG